MKLPEIKDVLEQAEIEIKAERRKLKVPMGEILTANWVKRGNRKSPKLSEFDVNQTL